MGIPLKHLGFFRSSPVAPDSIRETDWEKE